jgi:hypothetical protein
MAELDPNKSPDSKWFWIILLIALLGLVVFWFANPLGSMRAPPTEGPTSQSTPVDPADQASPSVPLTLPSTSG